MPRAWLRTVNPFYWLGMGLAVVQLAPFLLLGFFGVEPDPIARSAPGTAFRLLLRAATLAALVVLGLWPWACRRVYRRRHMPSWGVFWGSRIS